MMQDKTKGKRRVMLMVPLLDQGGLERVCALTAQLLKDKCELCLVVFSTKNMLYDVSGVDMIDLNLGSVPGKIGKVLNVFRRIRAVRKIKKERKTEITYSFGPTANLINVLTKTGDQIWVGIRGYGALSDRRSMNLLCKRADKVVCCTKVMADDIKNEFGAKDTACLYNPCDLDRIERLKEEGVSEEHLTFLESEGPLIASMSRADAVKGFWHQVKALKLIKKEIPDAKLMIIGDGDFSEYKKLAEDLGLESSVLFTGLQKNPFAYLKYADLYMMTSVTEGFPNSLVEAMAVGLPVMSVNCKTGPAEILTEDYLAVADDHVVHNGEYGILLPVIDPQKNLDALVVEKEERVLAMEAVELLRDEERCKMLSQKAHERSRIYTTESYVNALLSMME